MTLLTELWTAVGFSDERIAIFLAEDLTEATRTPMGAEEELARIVRLPFDAAVDMVSRGEITDAKSVAGLLLAAVHHGPS
jgi:ADP-ribose pyrophosphatase